MREIIFKLLPASVFSVFKSISVFRKGKANPGNHMLERAANSLIHRSNFIGLFAETNSRNSRSHP